MSDTSTFDHIIIGAGSAGCLLAGRLTEKGDRRILLLEAGGRGNDWLINIPFGVAKVWNMPKYNWSYQSEAEPFVDNRSLFHPRGKVVGGSAAINMMAYVRGHQGDYDRWAQMGLPDWSFEKVLPYFRKTESHLGGGDKFHGGDGPMTTQASPTRDTLMDCWLEAGRSGGYGVSEDYNGAQQEGLSRVQNNLADGQRHHSAHTLLKPALQRGNVQLVTGALVNRLLLEGTRVVGVEYSVNGATVIARSNSEVILSAGAYNSPQVLMRSGIGPATHLQDLGIAVIADRKDVGGNLQDHPAVGMEYELRGQSEFQDNLRYDRLAKNMLLARLFGTGPAAQSVSFGTGFVKSRPDLDMPDLQFFFRRFSARAAPWFPLLVKKGPTAIGFTACHLRPESRGTVRLASADPADAPRILNNFLSTPADRQAMRATIRIIRDIVAQPSFDDRRGEELFPGKDIQSDDAIDAYIRSTMATVFHPCGTCRMGADEQSIVDPQLKVRGVENLRVIDASVFPDVVGGNINACTMMVAEKGADYILAA